MYTYSYVYVYMYNIINIIIYFQSELDKMQDEFKRAYNERRSLIVNWEKVINQIQQRNAEIKKLSDVSLIKFLFSIISSIYDK